MAKKKQPDKIHIDKTEKIQCKNKKGKIFTILTNKGKYSKVKQELENDCKYTNDGEVKLDNNKKPIKLTAKDKAFRYGYKSCYIENARIFYKKKNKGQEISRPKSKLAIYNTPKEEIDKIFDNLDELEI